MTIVNRTDWRPGIVLACGSLVLMLSLGTRQSFGLFLQPISIDLGWGRETFAFALALQNLVWGVAQPFAGMGGGNHAQRAGRYSVPADRRA